MPPGPDRDFERRHPVLPADGDELAAHLREVFGAHTDPATTLLPGGRVNSNYRIDLPEKPEAGLLRLYARGDGPCQVERDILNRLQGQVPVPRVLYDGCSGTTPFLILSWVNGQTLENALKNKNGDPRCLGAAAGQALATIHRTHFPADGRLGPGLKVQAPFGSTGEVFDQFAIRPLSNRAGERLPRDLRLDLPRLIKQHLPRLQAIELPTVLVHSDFNPPNLLVDADRLTGVLDWEFAHAGNPLTDIANMLRPRPHQPDAFNQAFLAAYQKNAGPLPNDWEAASRLLDLLSQIEMLDAEEDRPVIFNWARQRISDTVTFLQSGSHI